MNDQVILRPTDRPYGHRPTEVLHSAAAFDGEPGCIAQARALADSFLARLAAQSGTGFGEHTRGDLMLAVSELVTNADRYSQGPYLLELEGTAERVSVTVYDSSTALPLFYSPDPTRPGGHGMEIVIALCDRLTAERVPVGKRIRAEFELSS
ncbi:MULTISPECIES: ATP-binding protein [unclassified Streptomyces]|jgi:anti-sigma regulatory factor (Ser/Thr protein kinase)|uniref:ATP-binding protein n=1 Tax=unclassified Streptomyces TaxID=2593676 RepID=UPI002DDBBC0B|nr:MULTISPECIES: ATP-binding protein [unclassified Streptomyces]WSA80499.1 ATP-binding protein [Streptomyces sp. NBC_01799]WSF83122.1 ATP-binding protein [Streptomyces sp. NBC_01744]WSA71980.1 ATP-binding protein [Streptomyces sp. NBC_01800]WSC40619.1 ATP-binding protein [Streptomyces sp. NBC_01763]WSC48754.1 ATP-binding protein [Streptomyces sp. NBC_01762]